MKINSLTLILIHNEIGEYELSQGTEDMALRFGYWRKVDRDKLQNIIGGSFDVVETNLDYNSNMYYYKLT